MDHLKRLGNSISISLPVDDGGFIGRECPQSNCEGYFKIELGTGIEGEEFPCHCPYCSYTAGHEEFHTKEQIEYIQSVAIRQISDAVFKDLKGLEFDHKPRGMFDIGISVKVERGHLKAIHYYREKQLETEVICSNCTLRYAVYGVFAFCPDCGGHNSLQILEKNLEVVEKMLDMAMNADKELTEKLIENALEDCVSAFDGFGREICRINASKATDPNRVNNLSFQNLESVRSSLVQFFKFELDGGIPKEEWEMAVRSFQKRHLVAHKMGVVDTEYVHKSGDTQAIVGRKVNISTNEVRSLVQVVASLSRHLVSELQ